MLYNYITKKVQLQLPQCEKLYKPLSKFERFVPKTMNLQPREKPSRYLGIGKSPLSLSSKNVQHLDRLSKNDEKPRNEKTKPDKIRMDRKVKKPKNEKIIKLGPHKSDKVYKIGKEEALAILSDYHSN